MSGSMMSSAAGAFSKVGTRAKGGIMESKPAKNIKASHEYNKKAAGEERASFGSNRWSRAYGRLQAGSTGYSGRAGKQIRSQEQTNAINMAKQEMSSDFQDKKIDDYDDQNAYMEAAGLGLSEFTDKKGNTVKVNTSPTKQVAAIHGLTDRGKDDQIRAIHAKSQQTAQGKQVWQVANETYGPKIAGLANDTTGRPLHELDKRQLVDEGAGTLRNGAYKYSAAYGDASLAPHRATLKATALEAMRDDLIPKTPEKLAWLQQIAGVDRMGNPVTLAAPSVDYANRHAPGSAGVKPRDSLGDGFARNATGGPQAYVP